MVKSANALSAGGAGADSAKLRGSSQAANLKRRAPPCVKTRVILINSLPTLLTLVYRPPIREVDVGLVYGPSAIEVVLVKERHYLVQIALVELPR